MLAVALTVLGCQTLEPAAPPELPQLAPTPFTAAQIRDTNPRGTRLVFRVEQAGQPPLIRTMDFVAGNERRTSIEQSSTTLDGLPVGEMEQGEATWEELRAHAAFPDDLTTRTDATCTVAAGTFDCWRYEVKPDREGDGVSFFYFARNRPGPPVLYEVYRDEERMFRMELLEDSRSGTAAMP